MKYTHFISDPNTPCNLLPVVAKNFIPDWYKKSEKSWIDNDGKERPGLKTCIPVLDALMAGYLLLTQVNIYIEKDDSGNVLIRYDDENESEYNFIDQRPDSLGFNIPRPAGHLYTHLIWTSNWAWKTPRGYSVLVTHPLNGWHLPFTTMSAVVDSDKFHGPGNIPFFLKENFEGLIPKGTPYAQIIPIKRKKWTMVHTPKLTDYMMYNGDENRAGIYKDFTWKKKVYLTEEKNERK